LKTLIELTLQKTKEAETPLPQSLKRQILRWVSYPSFLPIIYAIVKENAHSKNDLKKCEDQYNLPIRWESSGLSGLIGPILDGDENNFSLNDKIKSH